MKSFYFYKKPLCNNSMFAILAQLLTTWWDYFSVAILWFDAGCVWTIQFRIVLLQVGKIIESLSYQNSLYKKLLFNNGMV